MALVVFDFKNFTSGQGLDRNRGATETST